MSEVQNMNRVFSIRNVSEQLEVPPGTLRQWEKDFELNVPRTSNNVRYYTSNEIQLFQKIKTMRDKGDSVETIRQWLKGTAPRTAPDPIPELTRGMHNLNEQLLTVKGLLETLPQVIRAAIEEELDTVGGQLRDQMAAAFRQRHAEENRIEIKPETAEVYVARAQSPQRKKKSVWSKQPRSRREKGKSADRSASKQPDL